jgi:cytoskeletal protein RodZ
MEDSVKIRQSFLFKPSTLVPALALTTSMMIWGGTLSAQTSPPDTQAPAQSTQQPQPDTPPTQATPPSQTQDQTTPTQTPSQAPDQATPAPSSPSQTAPADGAKPDSQTSSGAATASSGQLFTGTVVKSGDKYVLQEDGGTTYDVDHQEAVQKFEGKRVKVHGTLDATGKKILLQ